MRDPRKAKLEADQLITKMQLPACKTVLDSLPLFGSFSEFSDYIKDKASKNDQLKHAEKFLKNRMESFILIAVKNGMEKEPITLSGNETLSKA